MNGVSLSRWKKRGVCMAKEEKGKIKIRFFEVELEGTDATLQEVIRSVTSVAGRAPTVLRARTLPPGQDRQEGVEALLDENPNVVDTEEAPISTSSVTPSKAKTKKKSYGNPQVLDIDLKSGEIPFASYCKSKNPTDTIKKYLVCAAWFKEYRKEEEISIDHIYTCYRAMGWSVQKDMGQTFRGGKKQGYFDNGSKNGMWKINHIGLDKVLSMGSNT